MNTHESLDPYLPDRVEMWYGSIRQGGVRLDPETATADEVEALLGLYYFAPKKSSSQDGLQIERARLYLEGVSHTQIAEREQHEPGAIPVGKTAIGNAIHKRMAAIIAEELTVIESAPLGRNLQEVFRPRPMEILKAKIAGHNQYILENEAGQREFEKLLNRYELGATLRSGDYVAAGRAVNRVRNFLLGVPVEQIANAEGVTKQSVNKTLFKTFPRGVASEHELSRFRRSIRSYYCLVEQEAEQLHGTVHEGALALLEEFRITVHWQKLTDLQRLVVTRCIGSGLQVGPTELMHQIMPEAKSVEAEGGFRRQHVEAMVAFEAFVART